MEDQAHSFSRPLRWAALLSLSVLVPAAADDIYVTGFGARKLFHLKTDGAAASAIPLAGRPLNAVITPGGRFVYVSIPEGNSVSILRTADDAVIGDIAAPFGPSQMAIGNKYTRLYVANNTVTAPHVTIVDVTKLASGDRRSAVAGSIDLSPVGANSACAVAAFGAFLAVGTQTGHVLVYDTSSDTPRLLARRNIGTRITGLVFSPFGAKLYVLLANPQGGIENARITPPGNLYVFRIPGLELKAVIAAGSAELKSGTVVGAAALYAADVRGVLYAIDIGTDEVRGKITVGSMLAGIGAAEDSLYVADPAQDVVHRLLVGESRTAKPDQAPVFLGDHVAPVGLAIRTTPR